MKASVILRFSPIKWKLINRTVKCMMTRENEKKKKMRREKSRENVILYDLEMS